MTTLLFPSNNVKGGPQKRLAYAVILTDISRASSDAIDALTLFNNLLHGRVTSAESLGFMAFDAHGGDTGCQLRAGMIQDLFNIQRQLYTNTYTGAVDSPSWLTSVIERLERAREKSRDVCVKLTKERIRPEKLGFGVKQDTPDNILAALGWNEEYATPLGPQAAKSNVLEGLEMLSVHDEESSSTWLGSSRDNTGLASDAVSSDSSSSGEVQKTSLSSTGLSQGSSKSSSLFEDHEDTWSIKTKWEMMEPSSIIRFLVYAFALSKYKKFCRLGDVIGARLDLEAAARYGTEMMSEYLNAANVEYKPAKIQRIVLEFRNMQEWLSDYSCAWIRSLGERSYNAIDLARLIGRTVQTSAKGLTATACYPAYLLQREHWARTGISLVLIDRHFCPHGWHYNVFEATLETPIPTQVAHPHASGLNIVWNISRTSIGELLISEDKTTPHLTVMGNSIAGSYERYMDRIPTFPSEEPSGSKVHHGPCTENEDHVKEFEEADHDRLALSFFAEHELYAFPLSSKTKADEFLENCLDEFQDEFEHVRRGWEESKLEADEIGAGKGSIHVLGWQHMFADTIPRLGARLKVWQEMEELMPLSSGCAYSQV